METVLIVLLMLSNAWAIFFLMNEKQPAGNREEEKPQGRESGGGVCDIMGPSRFRMPESRPSHITITRSDMPKSSGISDETMIIAFPFLTKTGPHLVMSEASTENP